eukprot:scaffold22840_cov16-Tisochrysis_lutea.AAC.1
MRHDAPLGAQPLLICPAAAPIHFRGCSASAGAVHQPLLLSAGTALHSRDPAKAKLMPAHHPLCQDDGFWGEHTTLAAVPPPSESVSIRSHPPRTGALKGGARWLSAH